MKLEGDRFEHIPRIVGLVPLKLRNSAMRTADAFSQGFLGDLGSFSPFPHELRIAGDFGFAGEFGHAASVSRAYKHATEQCLHFA